MTTHLFRDTLNRNNSGRPPVWLMRQAGRYHSHYQALKKNHEFIELCKNPDLACEVTLGPVDEFNFDAAILFSDLLFPLESMGMGLSYDPGPKLSWHLRTSDDLSRFRTTHSALGELQFQAEALKKIRKKLPSSKGLIGFVGGPLTLYFYAVEGSHQGDLSSAHQGLFDGRYDGFVARLSELLADNMALQARAGADVIAMMDTCAGELDSATYREKAVPIIRHVLRLYEAKKTGVPVLYYSKKTTPDHWSHLEDLPISGLGIDWNHDLSSVLSTWSSRWVIQGNIDPRWLLLPQDEMLSRVSVIFEKVLALPSSKRASWICGLGHGVLPETPESNVHALLRLQREMFQ